MLIQQITRPSRIAVSRVQHYSQSTASAYNQWEEAQDELECLERIQAEKALLYEQLEYKRSWYSKQVDITSRSPWKSTRLDDLKGTCELYLIKSSL